MSDALPSIVDSDFRQVAVGGSARLPARYRGRGPAAGPTLLSRSISRHLRIGIVAVLLVVVGIGGWATLTDLASAVVAGGTMVVDSSSKKVQHPIGGIVAELLVHDGDSVKAGDVLVRLDATQTRAVAAMVSKDLIEMLAQQARLEAERDDRDNIVFPQELTGHPDDPGVARALVGEHKLFELGRAARRGQKAQLGERVNQLRQEIQGLNGQAEAKKTQINLLQMELSGLNELWDKRLIPYGRLTVLQREAARLEGERNQVIEATAGARAKITETELQIIQVDADLRAEVGKTLADVRTKVSDFQQRWVAADDQLKRIDIRAPQDGTVHQLTAHTIGGVIAAGETIMLIVPTSDTLVVEAKIQPRDIDQVTVGQKAALRFTSFNQRTTPELDGEVSLVSADLSQDQRTGQSYYTVRATISAAEIERLHGLKLTPGMPVEVFIQTGQRTALSYLLKPMQDQLVKAFKEK